MQCSQRYSEVNNKYMSDYDPSKPSVYIMYFDVNNLCGYAMSEFLPHGNFRSLDNVEYFNVNNIAKGSKVGSILEIDLEYPTELRDYHNDLLLCTKNKKNEFMQHTRLITDLNDKTKYVIHYRNLQQCLQNEMILKKIHRIVEFQQSVWLKSYIDLNNEHRTASKNAFDQNFLKLMNNAVYVEKRQDIRIVCSWESKGTC